MKNTIDVIKKMGSSLLNKWGFYKLDKKEKEGIEFAAVVLPLFKKGVLSDAELRVYAVMVRSANKDGYAYWGWQKIADYLGFNLKTVKMAAKSLADKGMIVKDEVKLGNNRWKSVYAPMHTVDWGSTKKPQARTEHCLKPGQSTDSSLDRALTEAWTEQGPSRTASDDQPFKISLKDLNNRVPRPHGDEPRECEATDSLQDIEPEATSPPKQGIEGLTTIEYIDELEFRADQEATDDEDICMHSNRDDVENFIYMHASYRELHGLPEIDYMPHVKNIEIVPKHVLNFYNDSEGYMISKFHEFCDDESFTQVDKGHRWEMMSDRSPSVMVDESVFRRFLYWYERHGLD